MTLLRRTVCLLVVALVGAGGVLRAGVDDVPAATLLLPYFEVDLSCASGAANTIVEIENTAAEPTLVHITFWSDLSFPSINFDLYLEPGSTETFDLAAAFCNGTVPTRAADPSLYPNCDGILPYSNPVIQATSADRLLSYHTGSQSPGGLCHAVDYGDQIARGYLTIDAVTQCSLLFPSEAAYYAGGVLSAENPLRGSFRVVDPVRNLDEVFPAVHLEADSAGLGPGDPTFYERYLPGGFSDSREPLPSTVSAPYRYSSTGDTLFFLWREGGVFGGSDGFACGPPPALPPALPAGVLTVEAFDGPDEMGALAAPYEVNRFDFASLATTVGADGQSEGVVTATFATQSALLSVQPQRAAIEVPTLSAVGLAAMVLFVFGCAVVVLRGRV